MRRAFFTIRTVPTYSWRAGSKTRQNANATREKKTRGISLCRRIDLIVVSVSPRVFVRRLFARSRKAAAREEKKTPFTRRRRF
jgi:hypothetical protein